MNNRLEVPKFASTALRRAREASNALTIHLSDSDLPTQRGQDVDACASPILHRALQAETADHGVDRH
jgi:hypothetical protein